MPEFILVLSILCIIILGYYLMKRLDAFLAGGVLINPSSKNISHILLFGLSSDTEIINVLEDMNVIYDLTDNECFTPLNIYKMVFACSDNDMNNLMICSSAKRSDNNIYTVAKCNNRLYETVFRRDDVDKIVYDSRSIIDMLCKTERIKRNDI
ncbi:MAG: NAD-binding protein [Eubacteriales bacterium]